MIQITLKRIEFQANYTKGKMIIDNIFSYSTIEPPLRGISQASTLTDIINAKKIGYTAAPAGSYKCVVVDSPKFGMKVLRLMNVLGATAVEVHMGNSSADTEECILVGLTDTKGRDWIGYSLTALRGIMTNICNKGDNDITLTIN